jgi:hypothetical protein
MIDPKAAIVLSAAHGMDQVAYADAISGFESAGFSVVVEQRDLEFFASLQYLAPAALMVYVLKPYADKFLGKLAEDNYESCKAGLKALWANFSAKDRNRYSIVIGTKGKVTDETLSTDISFLARTADEQAFRLLFPRDISEEHFQKAIRDFYALMAQHDLDPKLSPLSAQPPFEFGGTRQRILTIACDSGRLVEVDVLASAQQGSLVTVDIADRYSLGDAARRV